MKIRPVLSRFGFYQALYGATVLAVVLGILLGFIYSARAGISMPIGITQALDALHIDVRNESQIEAIQAFAFVFAVIAAICIATARLSKNPFQ